MPQWVGTCHLSNGKFWRQYAVRVEAPTAPRAANRAVGQAMFKQREALTGKRERITHVKVQLQRIKATPKSGDDTTPTPDASKGTA